MRVIITFAILAICLSLSGCSRANQAAYAKPRPSILQQPTKAITAKNPLPISKSAGPTKVTAVEPSLPIVMKPPIPSKPDSRKPPLPLEAPPLIPVHSPISAETKFKAAQEKAKLSGVHTLTQEDIDGLNSEQIKELRGY